MANRDLATLDGDLKTAENDIKDIKKELGSTPSGNPRPVLQRITDLEQLTNPAAVKLKNDVATHGAEIQKLQAKIKETRWMIIGGVAALQLVKFDMQLLKVDITFIKEWKLKDVIQDFKTAKARAKALFSAQAKAALAADKQRKADEKTLKEEFEKTLKKLPDRVDKIEDVLKRARDTTRDARNNRDGLPKNHKGIEAKDPRIGPVTKDVGKLRDAVDALTSALDGLGT
ncbi:MULTISPECIES: hypothetical protein [unclassified Streptomyces]|uniref:hypothetical protein n=1 Tax=unclassified Streptomyces TaxID=2593676 RepID=UPI000378A4CA|nr:hypothetical protein [Streptomyces sp. 303MFCol5.2]